MTAAHAEQQSAPESPPRASGGRSLRDIALRAGLDALYLTIGLATSVLGFAVLVAGVTTSASTLAFLVGLPIILASSVAFRWCAELDRYNAQLVLGRRLHGRYRDHRGERFLARVSSTLRDPQTWKDLAWLVAHSLIGFGFGCAAVVAVTQVVGTAVLPAWYWALPDGADWGIWRIDTLGEALLAAPLAIPMAAIAALLLRGMALGQAKLAEALLDAPRTPGTPPLSSARPRPAPDRQIDWGRAITLQITISTAVGLLITFLWGVTGAGTFWPIWVWFGLAVPLAAVVAVRLALRAPRWRLRVLAIHAAISAWIAAVLLAVYALAGGAVFWPLWPICSLGLILAVHATIAGLWPRLRPTRERELAERVDVLTRTRAGALDVQAAELRRIERDLHDGAQARLVALSMQLGRAEERLEDQPEVADLVRRAREEAGNAIAELRDLARGIAPPVLADRGLVAAVEALGRRSPIPVTVDAALERRPLPVVETAAYFVVAEALTNAAKHAGGAPAHVELAERDGRLVIAVRDEGPGGADAHGTGLTGLRHRVEALDGTLDVRSAAGGGTIVRAELPCRW